MRTPVALITRRSDGFPRRGELGERQLDWVAGVAAGADLVTGVIERRPGGRQRQHPGHAREPRIAEDAVDRRQRAKRRRHGPSVGRAGGAKTLERG